MTISTEISASLRHAFAPQGRLRASINLGNPTLAGRDPATHAPVGVSIDLSRALAERLGLALEWVVWDAAGKSVDAVVDGQADVGFFAIDPRRGEHIAFTPPYVLIEGSYLVPENSLLQENDDVDCAGITVTVGKSSAYDLFLTRTLQHATIARAPTSPAVVEHCLAHGYSVAAGVRQQLQADAARLGGLRLLPGRFMVIRQAMGIHKQRGDEALHFLERFIAEVIASGFVQTSLWRHGIEGAVVAPAQTV